LDIFGVDAEELGVIDEDDDDHMEGDEDEEDEYYSEDDEEGAGGENDDDEEGGMSYSRAAKKRQTKRRMKALHKIEDIFEPLELEKNLMTEYDQQIRIEDKPERFMMRTVPVTAEPDENELEREADWIYNHAFLTNSFVSNRELFTLKDARCIPKIKDVLNFIRNEFFEVPFIATYRKEYIQPDLSIEDLWKIYDWDEKVSKN
jgi:transcription elongation factor SPT6